MRAGRFIGAAFSDRPTLRHQRFHPREMSGDSNCDKPTTGRVRNKRVAWLARGLNWQR